MQNAIPQFVEAINSTVCGLPQPSRSAHHGDMSDTPEHAEIGHRLLMIRKAFSDLSQKAWAERHNFSTTQYNNWEKGERRIPVECAERLCETYGLTLDFIYRGRRDGLAETASKVL